MNPVPGGLVTIALARYGFLFHFIDMPCLRLGAKEEFGRSFVKSFATPYPITLPELPTLETMAVE